MGNEIKEILLKKNIKQVKMAKDINIVNTLLNMIINGWRKPNEEQRKKISDYLNVDENELFFD